MAYDRMDFVNQLTRERIDRLAPSVSSKLCSVISRHSSMTYAVQCYLKAFLYDQCCAVLSQGIPL